VSVKELIDLLSKYDPNRIVVMAKDSEGNGYSPLHGCQTGAYRAETTWYGDVGLEPGEEIPKGYGEEDVIHDGVPALILTPVN
jgi:hypothetical protein